MRRRPRRQAADAGVDRMRLATQLQTKRSGCFAMRIGLPTGWWWRRWRRACLPPRLPCRLLAGDLGFRYRAVKRSEIIRNLRQVLGDEIGPEEAQRQAREFFRMISCEVIDAMLLRDRARPLGKLVEIRGREHLEAALAGGKGAILCNAHMGSYNSGFSLLHEGGFPLTTIGRSLFTQMPDMSPLQRRVWNFVYIRRMRPPAAAGHRATSGPDSGRGAGRSRASRQ